MADKYIRHGETYDGDGTTSAAALGSTVTISNASPGVVTWNSHPFVANDAVYFSTTGALPTGLTAGTKYFVRNPATNTFEVSATSGGASINTSSAGSGTHTARGSGAWNSINILEGTTPAFGSLPTAMWSTSAARMLAAPTSHARWRRTRRSAKQV